ncbi:MAG: acyl carrier protein [Candidatus Latescibacteria bacterium]|nr:acyl carrier protein [Candidatus Latescibacterota bacterium]
MSQTIESIIARVLDIAPDQVADELEFQGIPQWDSMRHVDLMLALEEVYDGEIDADQIVELTSVRAIRIWAQAQGG